MELFDGTYYLRKMKSTPPVESVFAVFFIVMFTLSSFNLSDLLKCHGPRYYLHDTCNGAVVEEPLSYVSIYIDSEKKLWVGNSRLEEPSQFSQRLEDEMYAPEKIMLKIDKRVDFGTVQNVMRLIKKTGIKDIVLITNERAALMDFGCNK